MEYKDLDKQGDKPELNDYATRATANDQTRASLPGPESFGSNTSSVSGLNLGASKNYKSKVIQDRWEDERRKWLHQPKSKADPRDGVP